MTTSSASNVRAARFDAAQQSTPHGVAWHGAELIHLGLQLLRLRLLQQQLTSTAASDTLRL
jgi:hypothetical protein